MMLYSRRSAKSVACSRLNVIGVSEFFFLPAFVAALTSADEFHSVTKTGWPAALSHFASSPSCVVFPDPSMPSTTNSFPGNSCGVVSLVSMRERFLVIGAGDFEADRLAQHGLERGDMPVCGPELQLRVAGGAQASEIIVAARIQLQAGQGLGMAAIETLGQTDHRGHRLDRLAGLTVQVAEALVRLLRRDRKSVV